MSFKQVSLANTTTVGTFVIVSLPGINQQDFINTLREALSAATPTQLQRDTNVISQQLLSDDSQSDVNICLWSLHFNGIHAPGVVQGKCLTIYESVREKVETVGTRASFRLETLQGAWEVE
jgi:hypothetical protein